MTLISGIDGAEAITTSSWDGSEGMGSTDRLIAAGAAKEKMAEVVMASSGSWSIGFGYEGSTNWNDSRRRLRRRRRRHRLRRRCLE